jgi:hypothetical protein
VKRRSSIVAFKFLIGRQVPTSDRRHASGARKAADPLSLAHFDSLYGMSDIHSTEREKFGDLSAEQYELALFRGELVEGGRPGTVEFVLPLIDKRLQEIRGELERLGSPPSPPAYADAVRDSEEDLADIAARLGKDATESI